MLRLDLFISCFCNNPSYQPKKSASQIWTANNFITKTIPSGHWTGGAQVPPWEEQKFGPRSTRLGVEPSSQADGKFQDEEVSLGMRPALDHTA